MNVQMHGMTIKSVLFPDTQSIESCGETQLVFSATHHGDRDEFWVIKMKGGKEVSRHNARYIESIEWG